MFVDRSNPFVCWWRVTNYLVNDLKRARKRNRKNGIRHDGGSFFGCFISEIVTRDGRMTRNLLDENGGQNGVDRVTDGGCSRMR